MIHLYFHFAKTVSVQSLNSYILEENIKLKAFLLLLTVNEHLKLN